MDALKKFINKKKADKAFKSAGPGHKLTEEGKQQGHGSKSSGHHHHSHGTSSQGQGASAAPHRAASTPSDEKRAAAAAALARIEKNKKPEANSKDMLAARQTAYIKEQARKQLEAEKKSKEEGSLGPTVTEQSVVEEGAPRSVDPADYAVCGVYFSCPLIGPEVLTKREIEDKIKEFLLEQPEEEIGMTSCLLIHSCNKPMEKITGCVETLCKYLDNIITNPDEPKFQRIRCSNKAFQERVAAVVGAEQFLKAVGFKKAMMKVDPSADQKEEFWVFSPTQDKESFLAHLTELRDTLKVTNPIKPELDRNVQVLMPAQVTKRRELPDEFYCLTIEEIKKEQKLKAELAERELTLRTQAMRERDEIREQRLYRYGLMRIRFPDGFTLQGTFKAFEKVSDLYNFVQENLVLDNLSFDLIKSGGENLSNMNATLAEMKLAPSSILNFKVHTAPAEYATGEKSYLKDEILALVRRMD